MLSLPPSVETISVSPSLRTLSETMMSGSPSICTRMPVATSLPSVSDSVTSSTPSWPRMVTVSGAPSSEIVNLSCSIG